MLQTKRQRACLQFEALGVDESALVGKDEVRIQGAGIWVTWPCLHIGVTGPGNGRIAYTRLAQHSLGVLAVLALYGDVGWLVLQSQAHFVRASLNVHFTASKDLDIVHLAA